MYHLPDVTMVTAPSSMILARTVTSVEDMKRHIKFEPKNSEQKHLLRNLQSDKRVH